MDKTKIRNYQIFSIIFAFILGTLLHFTYQLSGENQLIALFSAVNESVWEHLKLLYFPMLLTAIIGYFYIGKDIPNYLCSKVLGIIASIVFIVIFFYTYTGIIGKSILFVDIASFFAAVILGEYLVYKLINSKFNCNKVIAVVTLLTLLLCFIIFTYFPPKLEIFKDSLTNGFGITKGI